MIVAVVGVGLVGGSVGLAARSRLGAHVRGVDPAAAVRALERGAIDEACDEIPAALRGADAAFVAVPVDALPAVLDAVLAAAPQDCVVTDVGSAKRPVVEGREDPRFVGGHPLAGAEAAGVEHAREDLFDGATWYLTPTRATAGVLYERLHRMLGALGARPVALDAVAHDRIMATVSHLPHVLANVLVGQAAGALDGEALPAVGPSFRDATRVAGANPPLWNGIYAANRDALGEALDSAIATLAEWRERLGAGEDLAALQERAARERAALLEDRFGGPLVELRAAVPNRPGVVADLALALGHAGINISDMALAPSPDNTQGVIALWVKDREAGRAAALVRELGFPVSAQGGAS
ncbi:MAG TPA: prephenate dehydrogenase/arogenate dehydrogenase family protein [Solirubrobacteraceae bacterium]|nr:prephenate dehydrogenase/arogenate dehydrogenase family protein [Solirubrobacteraceae bacterium]